MLDAPRTHVCPQAPAGLLNRLKPLLQDDALDGFPVRDLLDAWAPDDSDAASGQILFGTVLLWLHGLDEAIEQFPPADTAVMVQIKDQLTRSRVAMAQLLASLGQHLQADAGARPAQAARHSD